jgi:hypothetical protein
MARTSKRTTTDKSATTPVVVADSAIVSTPPPKQPPTADSTATTAVSRKRRSASNVAVPSSDAPPAKKRAVRVKGAVAPAPAVAVADPVGTAAASAASASAASDVSVPTAESLPSTTPPAKKHSARTSCMRRSQSAKGSTSPRAAVAAISAAAGSSATASATSSFSYKRVREVTNDISSSIARHTQIAVGLALSKESDGSYEYAGKTYKPEDLRAQTIALARGIRRIPAITKESCSRTRKASIDDLEVERRTNIHRERATRGAAELGKAIDIPAITPILTANSICRANALKKKSPSKPEAAQQISSTFYVSDNFIGFVRQGNFGNGIALLFPKTNPEYASITKETRAISGAEDPDGALTAVASDLGISVADVLKKLGVDKAMARNLADPRFVISPLIIDRGIATSPILMSLMAHYINVNGLRDPTTGRIHVDENMRLHFGDGTNTRWVLNKHDYTPDDIVRSDPQTNVDRSGLDRILSRSEKTDEAAGGVGASSYDGKTFLRSMAIALACMYRIPTVPEKMKVNLSNPRIVNLAVGVSAYI